MKMQDKIPYEPKDIEKKWQDVWEKNNLYKSEIDKTKTKMHVLDMFPYPSGEGLHAGHAKIFGASDIYARMKRMQGFNVLKVQGYDAFGLPAEQFAIKNKVNPKISTKKNTENFERQMRRLGLSYDWSRSVNTTDPKFYKWTQWIFKQLYKDGLCFESHEPINWCPSCKTGLANEDLEDGKCERCGSVVEKKPIRQWVIKITDYAEKLLSGVDNLNWKESIKEMQRNWIGKSEGAEIDFRLSTSQTFTVFTTRPDTLFGCTYCVFAPENKLVEELLNNNLINNGNEVKKYILEVKDKSEIERTSSGKEKTGVKLEGVFAINPANQKEVPVYIADYVLNNYGTGAIMAVPAHDERDFEFAKKFDIEIIELEKFEDKNEIVKKVGGKMVTKYKLRDWVFARQRYWGEPFPIVFDENHNPFVVADSELPVILPDVESYEPTGDGESPLKNIQEWVEVNGKINSEGEFESDENGKIFYRETNTMPQWAGSSWYWLRYMDPHNDQEMVNKEIEKYWGDVDIYLGGMEHATRHLIYGRFWNQFLFDKKIISTPEPFKRLEAVGLVLGEGGMKMSKRLGNVINPDDIADIFGVDTLRLYIAFAGDYHDDYTWDTKAIVGPRRFIERVWNMQYKIQTPPSLPSIEEGNSSPNIKLTTLLHQTIKKVSNDYEKLQFNTAVAQMMTFINAYDKNENIDLESYKTLLKLLAPICPFVTEEIWESLTPALSIGEGAMQSIHQEEWPKYDELQTIDKVVNIAIQINGKLRDTFSIATDSPDVEVLEVAKNREQYKKWVGEVEPKKIIVIKNKIVNVVL